MQHMRMLQDILTLLTPLLFVLGFTVVFLLVRWHKIVVPLRRLTRAQIEGVEKRLEYLLTEGEKEGIAELLKKARCRIERRCPVEVLEFFFWPRGTELYAWRLIHEAESLLALKMNHDLARERLRMLGGLAGGPIKDEQLEQIVRYVSPPLSSEQGKQLQEYLKQNDLPMIRSALDSVKPELSIEQKDQLLYLLLTRGDPRARLFWELRRYYDEEDTRFARLSTGHAKIAWLMNIGLLLIVAILLARNELLNLGTGVFREVELWTLFGALGATLRRMTVALKPQDRTTDYGFYWIVLFLSPVFGALVGFTTLFVLQAAATLDVLSQALKDILASPSQVVLRLALAIVSGFYAERLLDRLLKQIEKQIAPGEQEQKSSKDSEETSTLSQPSKVQPQEAPKTQ